MPCAFEGQGWSPDHPDQLPLSFILARASKLSRAEPVMVCVMIKIISKFNFGKKKKEAGMEPYTVTIVGTGKSIDFYIFVKVGYYPLLALACTCILIHTVIAYCI